MNKATITYFGKPAVVACDRQCNKAWGINGRPSIQLSDCDDDWAWLPDQELGDAPGPWKTVILAEGDQPKPTSPDHFPTKWCVRECERSVVVKPEVEIVLDDFSRYIYNMPQNHQDEQPPIPWRPQESPQ